MKISFPNTIWEGVGIITFFPKYNLGRSGEKNLFIILFSFFKTKIYSFNFENISIKKELSYLNSLSSFLKIEMISFILHFLFLKTHLSFRKTKKSSLKIEMN